MSPQQRRLSLSLASLVISSWYRDSQLSVRNPAKLRREKESGRSRRKMNGTQPCVVSQPITQDYIPLCNTTQTHCSTTQTHYLPSYQSNYCWSYDGMENCHTISPFPPTRFSSNKSNTPFLSHKEPHLGLRSQERLKPSSSYLFSPSQTLPINLMNTSNLSRLRE